MAANGRKPTIEDYSGEGQRKGSNLKVGRNIGTRLISDTRGRNGEGGFLSPATVRPKPGPATEVEKATLEAMSRYVGKNTRINEKYGSPAARLLNGNEGKAKAEEKQNRRNAAVETRMTAQARSWQEAQKRTPEALAKKAAIQKQLDAAIRKAGGK